MTRILTIQHMYSAALFTLEHVFRERGFDVDVVEGFNTDIKSYNPLDYDAVVVLGGAMGVYEADKFPWLYDEIELIKTCYAHDHPLLGICLGAQLMAAAAGKRVYKGTNGPEIGFMNLDINAAGMDTPLHHFAPDKTPVLQWHGDTFDLPDNATLLASTPQYTNQAFRIGQNAYGLQFHPEVNHNGFGNTLVEACANIDVIKLRSDGEKYLAKMIEQMRLFTNDLLAIWKI